MFFFFEIRETAVIGLLFKVKSQAQTKVIQSQRSYNLLYLLPTTCVFNLACTMQCLTTHTKFVVLCFFQAFFKLFFYISAASLLYRDLHSFYYFYNYKLCFQINRTCLKIKFIGAKLGMC